MRSFRCPAILLFLLFAGGSPAQSANPGPAPLINAQAVRERWEGLTDQDFVHIREARILMSSMSLGFNLARGLSVLAREEPRANVLPGYQQFPVHRSATLEIIPTNFFEDKYFVHFIATRWPTQRRLEQMAELMRPPWNFAESVEYMVAIYVGEGIDFEKYRQHLDALQLEFPHARLIITTHAVNSIRDFPTRNALNDAIREHYRGKMPILDIAALLSDDAEENPRMLEEYTRDATGVHANTNDGGRILAKGLLLAIHETRIWNPPQPFQAGGVQADPATLKPVERLDPTSPDYLAVRTILDNNDLQQVAVNTVVEIRNGRVVQLSIQEMGVRHLPEAIGELTELEVLHVYGDPELDLPRLRLISPAIGELQQLRELLANDNQLVTLPPSITQLRTLETLSLANNPLEPLPAELESWIRRFDPESPPSGGQQPNR